jgi:hypothetical protein
MKHKTANAHNIVNTKEERHTKPGQHNEYRDSPFTMTLSNHGKLDQKFSTNGPVSVRVLRNCL